MASLDPGIAYGVASAVAFGGGDFSGGVAARRSSGLGVAGISQVVGFVLLLGVVVVSQTSAPPLDAIGYGVLAGACGGLGLVALYQGLARGSMGLISALAASGSILIALTIGTVLGGAISAIQLAGVVCVIAAAAAPALGGDTRPGSAARSAVGLALIAALGFGLWYVLLDLSASGDALWSLVVSRATSATLIGGGAVLAGRVSQLRGAWGLVLLAGGLDVAGNAFYVLSRATLPVGLAAALAGVYPLVTALTARMLLGERLSNGGRIAVALAIAGIVLISLGE